MTLEHLGLEIHYIWPTVHFVYLKKTNSSNLAVLALKQAVIQLLVQYPNC